MIKITICDLNGEILRTVTCPANMAGIQVQPGEISIDGAYDSHTHYIDTGAMLAVAKPTKPAGDVFFDVASKSWLPTVYTAAQLTSRALANRSHLLATCDWTQFPDVPLATQLKWQPYRQALRDLTLQAGYPQTIVWPMLPL